MNIKGIYLDIETQEDKGNIFLIAQKNFKPNSLLFFVFGEIKFLKELNKRKNKNILNATLLLYQTKNKNYSRYYDFSKSSNISAFLYKSRKLSDYNCDLKRVYLGDGKIYCIVYTIKEIEKNKSLIIYDENII